MLNEYEETEPVSRPATYRYFIAYVFSNHQGVGNGWTEVTLPHPIRNSSDLQKVTNKIAELSDTERVTITGWQRFEGDRT